MIYNAGILADPAMPFDFMNGTFPKLLIHNANRFADRTAVREKDMGIWQSWTWKEIRDEVFLLANGLTTIGFGHGDKGDDPYGPDNPKQLWQCAAVRCRSHADGNHIEPG